MKKYKMHIRQGLAFVGAFSITVFTITGMIAAMVSGQAANDMQVEAVQTESLYRSSPEHTGPKYSLNDPEKDIIEGIVPEVTTETITQKSNRMEDIMEVLSTETE